MQLCAHLLVQLKGNIIVLYLRVIDSASTRMGRGPVKSTVDKRCNTTPRHATPYLTTPYRTVSHRIAPYRTLAYLNIPLTRLTTLYRIAHRLHLHSNYKQLTFTSPSPPPSPRPSPSPFFNSGQAVKRLSSVCPQEQEEKGWTCTPLTRSSCKYYLTSICFRTHTPKRHTLPRPSISHAQDGTIFLVHHSNLMNLLFGTTI